MSEITTLKFTNVRDSFHIQGMLILHMNRSRLSAADQQHLDDFMDPERKYFGGMVRGELNFSYSLTKDQKKVVGEWHERACEAIPQYKDMGYECPIDFTEIGLSTVDALCVMLQAVPAPKAPLKALKQEQMLKEELLKMASVKEGEDFEFTAPNNVFKALVDMTSDEDKWAKISNHFPVMTQGDVVLNVNADYINTFLPDLVKSLILPLLKVGSIGE